MRHSSSVDSEAMNNIQLALCAVPREAPSKEGGAGATDNAAEDGGLSI
jgi:hypothetical protein